MNHCQFFVAKFKAYFCVNKASQSIHWEAFWGVRDSEPARDVKALDCRSVQWDLCVPHAFFGGLGSSEGLISVLQGLFSRCPSHLRIWPCYGCWRKRHLTRECDFGCWEKQLGTSWLQLGQSPLQLNADNNTVGTKDRIEEDVISFDYVRPEKKVDTNYW